MQVTTYKIHLGYMNFDFNKIKITITSIENYLKQEYLQISTGRANPALLDGVMIDSYGSLQPIKNSASINLENARTMKINPWDKSHIKDIEKALIDSALPFSLSVDNTGIRVHIPQMTEESKKTILKLVKEKFEEARIKIRNVRHDTIKIIEQGEKNGDFSEDARNRLKDELQKLVDTSNETLEKIYTTKESDIMSV